MRIKEPGPVARSINNATSSWAYTWAAPSPASSSTAHRAALLRCEQFSTSPAGLANARATGDCRASRRGRHQPSGSRIANSARTCEWILVVACKNDTQSFLIKRSTNCAFFHFIQAIEQSWYSLCKRLRNELGCQVHRYPRYRVQTAYE